MKTELIHRYPPQGILRGRVGVVQPSAPPCQTSHTSRHAVVLWAPQWATELPTWRRAGGRWNLCGERSLIG